MTGAPRPCALVPTHDNPGTVGPVVEALAAVTHDVIVVDDASGPPGRAACEDLARRPGVVLVRRERNGGKGAAVKDGLGRAAELGFTHVLQVDADGQHDLSRAEAFLATSREHPEALVLGHPVYDTSAPRGRRIARGLTAFWVALELGGRHVVEDAMVGFRVYPVEQALAAGTVGDRMDFDIEIAVRMARAGVPVINLPVGVHYPPDGVSHFRMVRDNLSFFSLHARLCTGGALGWLLRRGRESRA